MLAVVVTGEFVAGQRSGIPVSSTDLINGLVPTPADTNYIRTFEGGPIDNLTNGRTNAPGSSDLNDFSNQQTAVFSLNPTPPHGPTWFATYRLPLASAPGGYDITQIDSVTGHQDNRTNQTIDIEVQFVGDPNFYSLSNNANFEYRPNLGSGAGRLRLTDTSGLIARGVRAIRFEADQEAVFRELDVIGTATTAPTAGPAAPTGLTANLQGSAVALSFTDQANNEAAFRIERAIVTGGVAGAFERVGAAQVSNGTGGAVNFLDTTTEIGQTYRYRVSAINGFAGGTASPAVTVDTTTPTSGAGVAARYFASPRWQGTPLVEQIDSSLSDNVFGAGSPHPLIPIDQFSAIYSGTLTPAASGTHTFDLAVDDTGLLFLSGPGIAGQIQVADNQQVDLQGGQPYQMVFLAAEAGGAAAFNLHWITPTGTVAEPIPTSSLNSQMQPVTAAPTNVTATALGSNSVSVAFLDASLNEAKFLLERAIVTSGVAGAYSVIAEDVANAAQLVDNTANANTTYSYRVRALNFEGNAVSDAVQVTTPPRAALDGATGAWFSTGFWGLPGRPAQSGLAVTATPNYREEVTTINFEEPNLNRAGIPTDNFSTVFTGKIVAPETGEYFILGFGDDDTHVFVNGILVSSDPGGHGPPANNAAGIATIDVRTPLQLVQGQSYNFALMQAEQGGGAAAILRWITPSDADKTTAELIPSTNLRNITDLPAAPTAGTPDTATATSATITWADVSTSELRYRVEMSTDPTFATVDRTVNAPINATSMTFTGLTQGGTYHFRIRGVNLEGEGAPFITSITTSATTTPPAAPTGLTARPTSERLTTLSWTDVAPNEESYVIFRRVNNAGNFEQVGTTDPNATSFTDQIVPALPTGTPVTYRVVARNAEGDSAFIEVSTTAGTPGGTGLPATVYANTTFTDDPSNPDDTRTFTDPDIGDNWSLGPPVAGIPEDNFSVRWQGQVQAEKTEAYTFQIEGDDQTGLTIIDQAGNAIVNIPLSGGLKNSAPVQLVAGQKYTIVMRHVELTGGASAFLRWSSATTPLEVIPQVFLFAADPNAPLQAATITGGGAIGAEVINLTINPNLNNLTETGYDILRSTTGAPGSFLVVGSTGPDATSFSDTQNLQLGQTYHYQVRPMRGATAGPVSNTFVVGPVAVGGTQLTYNGTSTVLGGPDGNVATAADNVLRLIDNVNDQTGTTFTSNAQNLAAAGQGGALDPVTGARTPATGFNTKFQFSIPERSAPPADGFYFVMQRNAPTAMGAGGGGMGYGGMQNSLGVKFDVYPVGDPNAVPPVEGGVNETGLYGRGEVNDLGVPTGFEFANGNVYEVTLSLDSQSQILYQRITNVTDPGAASFNTSYVLADTPDPDSNIDLVALMGGTQGFVGFTGATGGLNAEMQISNWTFNGTAVPFVAPVVTEVQWTGGTGGTGTNYGDAANWNGPVPNGASAVARFHGADANAGTVTVNVPTTLGVISFDNTTAYTLSGGAITLDNGASPARIIVTNGSHNILSALTGGAITIERATTGGTLTLGKVTASGPLVVPAGQQVILAANGTNAGSVKVGAGSSIGAGASLDVKDNDMVLVGTSANDVRALVAAGVIKTTAPAPAGKTVALAVAQGSEITTLGGSLSGQTFGAADTLIKYTYHGDSQLDGDVDLDDVALWSANFTGSLPAGTGGKTWAQGDWSGDGDVDLDDVALWSANFTGSLSAGSPGALSSSAPAAAALLPATPSTGTLANPTTPVTTKPVATPAKPVLAPTRPAARPVVAPVSKPAAKPVAKPAAKPATTAKPAVKPAGKTSPVGSLFSSTKIGSKGAGSVLGSKTGGVL